MARRYHEIKGLAEFTAKTIVSDEEQWKKFLHTAGHAPVDENTYSEARDYSEETLDLQNRISAAMGPGHELYFVTVAEILENPDRLHVIVNTTDEELINTLKSYNTDGVNMEIEYSAGTAIEE